MLNVSALYSLLHHRYIILVLSALRTCVIFVQYYSRGSEIFVGTGTMYIAILCTKTMFL